MKKTITLLFILLVQLTAQAELRSGHFFKTLQSENLTEQKAVECFSQWFALPQETEWCRMGERTDKLGMTRVEYRQYVGGVEVEHSQVLLHVKDGRVQTANGTVMEARRSPAKMRRAPLVYKDGTPVDEFGSKLLLVYTDQGYRYAMKVLSADRSEWIYTDAETGEVLKRIPTRYSLTAEPVKVTGSTIYSGEVQMDASYDSEEGVYYLYDQARNIHTMMGAHLPSYEQMIADKTLKLNFPDMEACDIPMEELDYEKLNRWMNENLTQYTFHTSNYFRRNGIYAYSDTPMFDSYRFKSVTIDRLSAPAGSGMVDLQPSESLPLKLMVAVSCLNSEGMIELQQEVVTKLPYTLDMTMTNDEIPREGATIRIFSISPGENGQEKAQLLATLEMKPDESGVCTWDNDMVKATALYEKGSWSAADIHWGMSRTYDFYKEMFARDSFDDKGAPVFNLFYLPMTGFTKQNYFVKTDMNNAFAMRTAESFMAYGMGGMYAQKVAMRPVVEISVMAHEFSHLVTGATAGLVYQGESGALNESFSDLMGISVKKYVEGVGASWTIGEDVLPCYSNLRSMAFPKESMDGDSPSPDTYKGEFWVDTEGERDNGGVHTNSGVQNKWYYLLSDGGTGTNDNNFTYDVTGIGIDKAQQIAYRTLTEYATKESQYADIRLCSLQAAEDLYGANSAEVESVSEAWKAVGVDEDDILTAIREIEDGRLKIENEVSAVYDLQGRPLSGKPTRRGLYIHGSKKIFIR